jgi:outer membrane protein
MNDRISWRTLAGGRVRVGAATLAVVALAAGCRSPFETYDDERGWSVGAERLRTVRTFDVDDFAAGDAPGEGVRPEEVPNPTEPPDPFEGRASVDVSLEQARAWALEHNLDLKVALIDPTIANERLNEEEAKFESTFSVSFRESRFDQPTDTALEGNQFENRNLTPSVTVPLRTGGTVTLDLPMERRETDNQFATLNPSFASTARFSISQPLLRNAGRRANTHSIRVLALESQISEAQTKLSVIRQLAELDRSYWRLYAARELLDVRLSQFELAREQLERAERRVRAGDAAEVEVIRAESGLADRLVDIIRAQNTVRNTQRALKRVMNAPGLDVGSEQMIVPLTEPDPVRYRLDPPEIADAAVSNRMEMLELELRLAQDLSRIDFQKNQALPNFLLDYTYTVNGLGDDINGSFGLLRDNRFNDWSLGVRLDIPLGNEAAEARVHQAILRRLQRLATKSLREQSIRKEVYDVVDTLEAAWQSILAARQSVLLAARTLAAEQNQFRVGARTSTDVLNAATALADAQQAEIAALTEYQVSQVDLAFATGLLLGAARIDWSPLDPRGPDDAYGEDGPPPGGRANPGGVRVSSAADG